MLADVYPFASESTRQTWFVLSDYAFVYLPRFLRRRGVLSKPTSVFTFQSQPLTLFIVIFDEAFKGEL